MASLVADYGTSSENESDAEESAESSNIAKQDDNPSENPSSNFLLNCADDDDDESSSEEEPIEIKQVQEETKKLSSSKLPNPLAGKKSKKLPLPRLGGSIQHSVFRTSYQEEEAAKESVLEQHVKMTVVETDKVKKRRAVCYNFMKGMCRKGSKCRFSHDRTAIAQYNEEKAPETETTGEATDGQQAADYGYYGNQSYAQQAEPQTSNQPEDDSFSSESKPKKRRAGVKNNLVPPKKAMQSLQRQRETERPWTVKQ